MMARITACMNVMQIFLSGGKDRFFVKGKEVEYLL
jgi:hypothetical protein